MTKKAEDLGYFESHIFVCQNERPDGHPKGCCAQNGEADKLTKYMKVRAKELGIENIRVNKAGCLDRCELGPVLVIYPQNIWYHYRTQADIDEIVESHLLNGQFVERLLLRKDQKSL